MKKRTKIVTTLQSIGQEFPEANSCYYKVDLSSQSEQLLHHCKWSQISLLFYIVL